MCNPSPILGYLSTVYYNLWAAHDPLVVSDVGKQPKQIVRYVLTIVKVRRVASVMGAQAVSCSDCYHTAKWPWAQMDCTVRMKQVKGQGKSNSAYR